jgi:shikimate dehydrogenase
MVYDRLECPLDGFAPGVKQFALDASAGIARGCNITTPFKFEAFALAARHTERAALAQAANVLCFGAQDAGGWLADNTDGAGLVRDIEGHAARNLRGQRVLLLGAGGAAAGVLGPLLLAGPRVLVIANRTPEHAQKLAARHADVAGATELAVLSFEDCTMPFDLVINATSSSLQGAEVPVGPAVLGRDALAVDLMYGTGALGFVRWAQAHGAQGRDGLGMLVEQAALAFERWRGVTPQTGPVLDLLRRELTQAAT